MKKLILFVLSGLLVLGLSVSAFGATTAAYTVDPSAEEDADSGIFNLITDAISWAEGEEVSELTLTLAGDYSIEDYEGTQIEISGLSELKTITITGGKTLTSAAGFRHFVIDNEDGITFILSNLTLTGDGGGVLVVNGTLQANSVTFNGLDATSLTDFYGDDDINGGAVSVMGAGAATFTNCTFANNTADLGGAIYASGTGAITFSGAVTPSTFTSNTATANGGALYLAGTGAVTFTEAANFVMNSAGTSGGAIYSTGSGAMTFSGITNFGSTNDTYKNSALNGGAMFLAGTGATTFSGTTTFSYNTATTSSVTETASGGAIYLAGSGALTLGGTVNFSENKSTTSAGAIYVTTGGNVVTSGTVSFTGNKTEGDGGALYLTGNGKLTNSSATLSFTDNHAGYALTTTLKATDTATAGTDPTANTLPTSGFGGAICFNSTEVSSLGAVTFDGNDAALGGAVYMMNVGTVNFTGAAHFGTSVGNKAYLGGGLFMSSNGTANFTANVSFDYNVALDHGGALYTTQNGNENITFSYPVSFSRNNANSDNGNLGDGGAVWWGKTSSSFATTFANGASFTNNSTSGTSPATINNNAGNGGAICIVDSGLFTIDSTTSYTFGGNTAFNKGGAVYTDTAPVTLSGISVSAQNTATQGGFIYSTSGTITVQNSSISNQQAVAGGALYGTVIVINSSSDLSSNSSTGDSGVNGGGAVYATNSLTVSNSTFRGNKSTNTGGAVYAVSSNVSMTNVFFDSNIATSNGGGVYVANSSTVGLEYITFANNNSTGGSGGAIYVDGTLTAYTSFFTGNAAAGNGGAIWFSQYGTGNGNFIVGSSMFHSNTSTGGTGGAIWVQPDYAQIESCTFDSNAVSGGTNARGGAVYIDTSMSASSRTVTGDINRSTFTRNSASGGSSDSCGGALATRGKVSVTSCTFSLGNKAVNRGGAIFIGDSGGLSEVTLYASIVVGNTLTTPNYGEDVWVENGSLISRNYNRIGYYGTGSGNQTWTGQDQDVQDNSWTFSTFFNGNSDLDVNQHSGSGRYNTIPPYIGSDRYTGSIQYIGSNYSFESGQVVLLTLMLSEDVSLPVEQRATNQIAANLRRTLPQYDERGVDVWALLTSPDIGAVMYEKISPWQGGQGNTSLVISRVQMSGIPNTLKSVGTTASLIALVYYTNGHVAYGGEASNCEPVTWSSSPASIVYVHPTNGYIIARAPGTATVTVTTNRQKDGGGYATDSRVVRVDSIPATYMNTVSQQYQNYFITYLEELVEHDLSLSLADVSASTVKASSFQRNFKSVWNVNAATQITELTTSTPTFSTPTVYNNSEGLAASKAAAVNINFPNRTAGDLFPLTYSWNFTGEEIKAALGTDLAGQQANAALAAKIFSALRIDYQTSAGTWPVIGEGGVSAAEAVQYNALTLTKADGDRGVHVELTAYLANVSSTGDNDGPQFVRSSGTNRLLVVPDGADDGAITGTMWMAQKASTISNNTPSNDNQGGGQSSTDTNTNTNPNSGESSGGGGGGGGGCESFTLGLIGAVLVLAFRRR